MVNLGTNPVHSVDWIDTLSDIELEEVDKRLAWIRTARVEQLTPPGVWKTWLYQAGRGAGKTRAAAEDVSAYALDYPGSRIGVVAESFSDGRDICVEGESGLLSILPENSVALWNRSLGELLLRNGSRFKLYSGDKPDQLRGSQHHRLWCDELSKFRYARRIWEQIQFTLRLGDDPRLIITTTPRPMALLKEIRNRQSTYVTRGTTFDNAGNLAQSFMDEIRDLYEGTTLGRQELHGEFMEEIPGSLWSRSLVERQRLSTAPEDLSLVVVAVDPAVTSNQSSDETGILVVGRDSQGNYYVLADRTCRATPDGWAKRVVSAYHEFDADRVVAEVNNGGDMVEHVIRTVEPHIPYRKVHATRGKAVRAEPVAALYEQGKVFHIQSAHSSFEDLEDQMCTYVPNESDYSPDRLDALVWGITDIMSVKGRRRGIRAIR